MYACEWAPLRALRAQWHSHKVPAACWQHKNGHSFAYSPFLRCCRGASVAFPWYHFHTSSEFQWQRNLCVISCRFNQHQLQDTLQHVDVTACASLLQQLSKLRDLPTLRCLHRYIIIHAVERLKHIERLLLYAYAKCGMAMDALSVFIRLDEPDLASWNFVIGSCAKHGERTAAFQLFAHMHSQGHLPDQYLYTSILSACCCEAGLWIGKCLHACINASIFANDVVVVTALVYMYGNCGSLDHAKMAFSSIRTRDVVSWNAIVTSHVQQGDGKNAIKLYQTMQREGFIPDTVTLTSILSACAKLGALVEGTYLHAQVTGTSSMMNMFMVTSLVNMYSKCGRTLVARRLFDSISKKADAIIWNAMISGHAQNGEGNDALDIFEQMKREGVKPTKATFIATLEACMTERSVIHCRQIHMLIKQSGYEVDLMVGTALLTMYGRCGCFVEAFNVFDKVLNRTVVTWNALIACYSQGGLASEVLQLFEQMLGEGVIPDKVTFVNILPVCSNYATVMEVKRMHATIANSKLESDDNVRAGLVILYGKLRRVDDARRIFYLCPTSSNISLWTALIAAWSQSGQYGDALECFNQMLGEGVLPDKVATITIFSAIASLGVLARGLHVHACIRGAEMESETDVKNALFSMYGKCGSIEAARAVFSHMTTRDAISYKALMTIFVQFDLLAEAIDLFWQMICEGVAPDSVSLTTILNACGSSGALTQGLKLHACSLYMTDYVDVDDLVVGTALLSMYACCGRLGSAWRVFQSLRGKEVFTWTAMMEACAFHGEGKTTISLFEHMQKEMLTPDRNAIIKLLSACSHAGLVDEAGCVFLSLRNYFFCELVIDHFNCMVDLLGRAGKLEEAEELVKRMPIPPNAMSWSSLLSGCRLSGDVHRGEFAALCIMELEPECIATYISLANMYAAAGALDIEFLNGIC